MITWLPEFATYADSTAAFAPFSVLPFEEYGKPVIHLLSSPSIWRTPASPPGVAVVTFATRAELASDGTVSGESSTFASGPFSVLLRRMARTIEVQGQQQAATQLRLSGEEGAGSFGFPSTSRIDGDYSVVGQFHLEPRPELLDGTTFPLPAGLRLLGRPGDVLLGPLELRELPAAAPTPCHPGTQVETLELRLPEGWRAAHVPADVTLDDDVLHYQSRWSVAGRAVSVRRELTSRAMGPLCEGETRRKTANALATIRRELASQIAIAEDQK